MSHVILASTEGSSVSSAISTLIGLVPDVINIITGNPVLMIFFCAGILGIVIGIIKRLKG